MMKVGTSGKQNIFFHFTIFQPQHPSADEPTSIKRLPHVGGDLSWLGSLLLIKGNISQHALGPRAPQV